MSLKRKITQQDLRKAMSDHKKKAGVKKIDSPLARYNEVDQLVCVLCKSIVRSEAVWPVHLNSKSHKDNVAAVKETKLKIEQSISQAAKRPSSPFLEPAPVNKKARGILKQSPATKTQSPNLPADFFDKSPSVKSTDVTSPSTNVTEITDSLVPNKISEMTITDGKVEEIKSRTKETPLPEGFFDDPIKDAKARNVEYKNPIEEEWEKFQKEIKEETAQSAQIIADDQEEATSERQIDEVEEQILHWARVVDLVRKKEELQQADRNEGTVDDDTSSGEEEDIDEFFLDWRAKSSYINNKTKNKN